MFVLSDLDIGMNQWMSQPFKYPDRSFDRGKVLWEKDLEILKGNWARYADKDNDGITYRTLPGNKHPLGAYFLRGTGHDEQARYTEEPDVWHRVMERLKKKYNSARKYVPEPVQFNSKDTQIGVIGFGSTQPAILEARHQLETRKEMKFDYLRVRALPFTDSVRKFVENHERIYVIELNRDGQLHQLLSMEYPGNASKFISIAFQDGLPATAKWVRESILAANGPITKSNSKRKKQAKPAVLKTAAKSGKHPSRDKSAKKSNRKSSK